jgi:hypothetical protein
MSDALDLYNLILAFDPPGLLWLAVGALAVLAVAVPRRTRS